MFYPLTTGCFKVFEPLAPPMDVALNIALFCKMISCIRFNAINVHVN